MDLETSDALLASTVLVLGGGGYIFIVLIDIRDTLKNILEELKACE